MNHRDPDENSDYKLPSREESLDLDSIVEGKSDFIEIERYSKPTVEYSWLFSTLKGIRFLIVFGTSIWFLIIGQKVAANLSEMSRDLKNIIIQDRINDDLSTNFASIFINDPNNLSKEEINSLIDFYGLNLPRKVNKDFFLDDDDVNRWHKQKLTLEDLQENFRSMKLLVDEYERRGVKIENKDYLYRQLEEVNRAIKSQ